LETGRNKYCILNKGLQVLFWKFGKIPNIFGFTTLQTLGKSF